MPARLRPISVFLIFLVAATAAVVFKAKGCAAETAYPPGFVSVADIMRDVGLDIRYYGTDNFVGERIDSYDAPVAILSIEAAVALKHAVARLKKQGYGIKIFDAYRPASAVAHFLRWGKDLSDARTRDIFYPSLSKAELFKKGYIAGRSGHSRGSTVDLTITDLASGKEVDMGSHFDFFGDISHTDSSRITRAQSENRLILKSSMEEAGFKPLSTEWWHFSLKNEPHPGTYFDFPVDNPAAAEEQTAEMLEVLSGGADRIVTAFSTKKENIAEVRAYERSEEGWSLLFSTPGFFGRNGVKIDKREGDGATPSGVYTFGRAFGTADDPGSSTPYAKVTDRDIWVDDPVSKYYNQWEAKDSPHADWNSAEQLAKFPAAYKYAIAVNYNTDPVKPGGGSAIFLHCSTEQPTAGCVSVPEPAMVFFLTFIQEGTKIAIGNDIYDVLRQTGSGNAMLNPTAGRMATRHRIMDKTPWWQGEF
jgi:D-alanyl-D-alanine dipeptidase/L,D-peptidoglycan transpeptidase YkuD (ErfK/YbiS/YcfS/YnhG family)